jgi:N-acetylmuramoyl-L-alanine amidase
MLVLFTGLGPIQLPGGHHIYSKKYWRGLEARNVSPLLHPTPVVIVSHTETQECHSFDQCSETVRRIQTGHIGKKGAQTGAEIADIGYNFLIGGDGNVYEGRGWDAMSFHKRPEGVLGISFIGNFHKHELTDGQIEAAQELLALGVKLGKLSPFYVLIAHNQTRDTDSPGKNVVKVIEKWPHWSPTYRIA